MDIVDRAELIADSIYVHGGEYAKEAAILLVKHATELKSLRNQLAECQKDAERYRWLRDSATWYADFFTGEMSLETKFKEDTLDAAIDAAIKAMSEKG